MSTNSKTTKPFALGETLRDLALLRASDVDLSSMLPQPPVPEPTKGPSDVDNSVLRSHEFASDARAALKIHNTGAVETQGERVETARTQLEEVLKGVEGSSSLKTICRKQG